MIDLYEGVCGVVGRAGSPLTGFYKPSTRYISLRLHLNLGHKPGLLQGSDTRIYLEITVPVEVRFPSGGGSCKARGEPTIVRCMRLGAWHVCDIPGISQPGVVVGNGTCPTLRQIKSDPRLLPRGRTTGTAFFEDFSAIVDDGSGSFPWHRTAAGGMAERGRTAGDPPGSPSRRWEGSSVQVLDPADRAVIRIAGLVTRNMDKAMEEDWDYYAVCDSDVNPEVVTALYEETVGRYRALLLSIAGKILTNIIQGRLIPTVADETPPERANGDEQDQVQKKTFTKWVNKHLTKEQMTDVADSWECGCGEGGSRDGEGMVRGWKKAD
ncbi:hypothetical protein Bbelb_410440 [Branchiostoma belcheri]|nr:hypothetical protein Bbelb_410440 [Branchiostoma belcheri]